MDQLHPQGMDSATFVRLLTANPIAPPTMHTVHGGTVVIVPSPGGVMRIVGLSEAGEWIAEFACREAAFTDTDIERMEQRIARDTGVRIAVVG